MRSISTVMSGVLALAVAATAANAQFTRPLTAIDGGGNTVYSGWNITVGSPGVIDLIADAIFIPGINGQPGTVVVQKFAEFRTIDPFTGLPQPLTITFSQDPNFTDAQTASRIVITDEYITNSSGQHWSAFQMALLPSSGAAAFNPALSAGFSTMNGSPPPVGFTNTAFSLNNTVVTFSGGPGVAPGRTWTPGLTAGGLVIDVDLSSPNPVVFSLKEIPLPTPGAAALLGLGGLMVSRRRR